jgi:hypothetical protein
MNQRFYKISARFQMVFTHFVLAFTSSALGLNPGLPVGLFSNKNPNLGNFWRVNVGIFYDHLEYFMAIWYNL